jgi:uncharacterized protein (UPF0333 family)
MDDLRSLDRKMDSGHRLSLSISFNYGDKFMLQAINTKILLSILAAVLAIGGLLYHHEKVEQEKADAIAKAAAIVVEQKKHDDELWRKVEEEKKKSKSANIGGSKTWTTYIP